MFAVRRDNTDERIYVDAAIHLENRKDFMGVVEKPEKVDCLSSTEIDHDVCSTELTSVYTEPDTTKSMLQNAWLLLHLKVTPNLDGSGDGLTSPIAEVPEESSSPQEDEPSAQPESDLNNETSEVSLAQNITNMTSSETLPFESIFSEESTEVAANETTTSDSSQNITSLPTTAAVSAEITSTQATNAMAPDTAISTAAEVYTFAVIPKSTNNVFFAQVKNGCEARAAALSRVSIRGGISIKCLFVGPQSEEHVEEQGEIALDLINSGSVDGISFSVMDPEIAATIVDSAVAANIPIITFDSDAPDTERSAYVGTDNIALGEEIAMVLLSRFATSGKYAILSIDANVAPNVFIRATGVRNKLNEHGWNEAVGSPLLVSPEVSKETFDLLHDHMTKHPDTDAILVTWGKLLYSLLYLA